MTNIDCQASALLVRLQHLLAFTRKERMVNGSDCILPWSSQYVPGMNFIKRT